MKNRLPAIALTASIAASFATPASADGWTPLFNGKDLSGWVTPKGDHTWKVIDGVIDYEAKGGNLVSEKEYTDYVLQLEWRFKRTAGPKYNAKIYAPDGSQKKDADGKPMTEAIPNADSGIFLRGTGQTQVNLWCWPCGSGQLWAYQNHKDPAVKKGAIPICNADKPVGEWNKMEITLKGEKLDVILNGKKVIDTTMPGCAKKGPIALQHHGGYNEKKKEWNAASALIQFRNIKIKELAANGEKGKKGKKGAEGDWKPLWNGKDFSGFKFQFSKAGTENKGTFSVKGDTIVVSGKPPGYMVTEKSYSKFVLEYDWAFTRPKDLKNDKDFKANSGCLIHVAEGKGIGVWPRSLEVQGMWHQAGLILPIPRSLKCQKTDDKEARKKATKPVGEWNTTRIEVDGGDMKIFVNELLISTVSDCELTEGPIAFQSEGKELSLRNIRILEK
jgi:hypothetical protein